MELNGYKYIYVCMLYAKNLGDDVVLRDKISILSVQNNEMGMEKNEKQAETIIYCTCPRDNDCLRYRDWHSLHTPHPDKLSFYLHWPPDFWIVGPAYSPHPPDIKFIEFWFKIFCYRHENKKHSTNLLHFYTMIKIGLRICLIG